SAITITPTHPPSAHSLHDALPIYPRSSTPTATAEMIDLNAAPPTWTSAGSMSVARRHLNSTILPDGEVLITGGTSGGGFVDINRSEEHTSELQSRSELVCRLLLEK